MDYQGPVFHKDTAKKRKSPIYQSRPRTDQETATKSSFKPAFQGSNQKKPHPTSPKLKLKRENNLKAEEGAKDKDYKVPFLNNHTPQEKVDRALDQLERVQDQSQGVGKASQKSQYQPSFQGQASPKSSYQTSYQAVELPKTAFQPTKLPKPYQAPVDPVDQNLRHLAQRLSKDADDFLRFD
ncbi:hypothetical protein [Eremococcus coleocola]|uniref:Uncharacterized protein n=1 Tax=Eremococcus coleocola ACS-139-V-Col8 TaxID=908337 RepID=E4KPJ3_9LACT|nr:hypothetical protein [Eremococcus coleocola]EFR31355.1 hypothetical protein HMPREF9257_1481 [Eremococcus coleocola ACS-139-V-Col8]